MPDLTPALWKGPSGYRLPDGTLLEKDESVVLITAGEAEDSDNWESLRHNRAKDAVAETDTGDPLPEPEDAQESTPEPVAEEPSTEGSDS